MLLGTQRVNARGHLEIDGCDAVDLARQFGTPLYVMDEATIRERCRAYLAAFRDRYAKFRLAYASKACLCAGICPLFEAEGLDMDVASGGELYTALQGGFPAARLVFHGNNKSEAELRLALEAGVGRIVVDNSLELERLEALAAERRAPIDILLRCTPGIDPHTHELVRTGQVDTKFGFDVNGCAALTAICRALQAPGLRLRGLHCHVGSQLLDTEAHEAATHVMVELLAAVRRQMGVVLEELNMGGGLGIRYREEDRPPSLDAFADALVHALQEALARHDFPAPTLIHEPGRALVGEAGTTLYTVGAIKEIPGLRTYVSVDGGLSDNPRPALYDARYEVLLANRAAVPPDTVVTIAGQHCETDTLFPDARLPALRPGDLLAVQSTGAYHFSMASNYNRYPRPAVVLVADGRADLLVRRETYTDLVRNDVMPERFRKG
ncbi:MAG: diaminopimelate decarboxylase [Armatimonadetes bacterium]|nr:diaminopimelate decarboxylase [Armatimonadota bacterium]